MPGMPPDAEPPPFQDVPRMVTEREALAPGSDAGFYDGP